MGGVDLVGPRGPTGAFIDVPPDVSPLFQQSLAQLWGFNNVEALRGFRSAARIDPTCALCWWGVAMSFAPNINYVVESQAELNRAAAAAAAAAASQPNLTPKSRLLIRSLLALNSSVPDSPSSAARLAYSRVLCAAAEPDADVDALCSHSLMSLSPWHYYNGTAEGGAYPLLDWLEPAKRRLARSVDRADGGAPHALSIHLLIHLLEPSNAPAAYRWEALRPTVELYRGLNGTALLPSQGHLTHMPAHLFLRVGRYASAVRATRATLENNARYAAACLNAYAYGHNAKMGAWNGRAAGMLSESLRMARIAAKERCGTETTPAGGVACVDCAGVGSPEAVLTLARFGRWAELLTEPRPASWGYPRHAAYNEASYHYARALALYASARADEADAEARAAVAAAASAPHYAAVIGHELRGARASRLEGDAAGAAQAYLAAVETVDSWPYMEPPRWYYPPRACLGHALLQPAGGAPLNASEALEVFTADLRAYPENGWSLLGSSDALRALGRDAEAEAMRERALVAWQDADVPLVSACPQLAVASAVPE